MSLSEFKLPSLKDKFEDEAIAEAEKRLLKQTKQSKVETKKEKPKKKKKK